MKDTTPIENLFKQFLIDAYENFDKNNNDTNKDYIKAIIVFLMVESFYKIY